MNLQPLKDKNEELIDEFAEAALKWMADQTTHNEHVALQKLYAWDVVESLIDELADDPGDTATIYGQALRGVRREFALELRKMWTGKDIGKVAYQVIAQTYFMIDELREAVIGG